MDYGRITRKKRELDGCRPLPPALVRNLTDWFRVELTYSSNAIEGNTLTHRETAEVIEHGITIGGKPLRDHLEARALGQHLRLGQLVADQLLQFLAEALGNSFVAMRVQIPE